MGDFNAFSAPSAPRRGVPVWVWIIAASVGAALIVVCVAVALVALFFAPLMSFSAGGTPAAAPTAVTGPAAHSASSVATAAPTQDDSPYAGMLQSVDRSELGVGLAIGELDAPAILVIYSDFSCPHCHDLSPTIRRLIAEYVPGGDLRVVYKPIAFVYPPYSTYAAQAAICAGEQSRFWEMYDAIWALGESAGPQAYDQAQFDQRAQQIGLDVDQFSACYNSADTSDSVQAVLDEAARKGVNGVPTMFLNGEEVIYRGPATAYEDLTSAIDQALGR